MEKGYGITALSPNDNPIEVVRVDNVVYVKYLCGICIVRVNNPVQSCFRHRFCNECFEHKMRIKYWSIARSNMADQYQ